ncbi:hypothetical protein [Burkholderia ubonensis]|uniref:hypothetical protein n=1 Tax=Burkholderia ubonensis TaxID=101571 RepID=UPI000A3FA2B2|nr:hypothetical protein [Burkholderia ubonensis]
MFTLEPSDEFDVLPGEQVELLGKRNRPVTPIAFDEGVLHVESFAKYAQAFRRNSMCSGDLFLQHIPQRLGTTGEIVQDTLTIAFHVICSARIDILHAITQSVVEKNGNLARSGGNSLGLADPG